MTKEIVLAIVVPVGFVAMWCGIVILIAQFGWRKLAKAFRTDMDRPAGERFNFSHTRLQKKIDYNGCVSYTVAEEGLHMQLFFPFRIGHPAIMIPWVRIVEVTPFTRFKSTLYRMEVETDAGRVFVDVPENVLVASQHAIMNRLG